MLRGVRCTLQHRHFTQAHNHFIVHMLAHVNPYPVFHAELRGVRCMLQHRHFTQTHNHFIVQMLAHVNPYLVFHAEKGAPTEASENTRREATHSVPP